jgi:hypothetical protein
LKGSALRTVEGARLAGEPTTRRITGEIADIGVGGLCLVTSDKPELKAPVRCEIITPGLSVGIPTLLQVRWSDAAEEGDLHRVGLQFLV